MAGDFFNRFNIESSENAAVLLARTLLNTKVNQAIDDQATLETGLSINMVVKFDSADNKWKSLDGTVELTADDYIGIVTYIDGTNDTAGQVKTGGVHVDPSLSDDTEYYCQADGSLGDTATEVRIGHCCANGRLVLKINGGLGGVGNNNLSADITVTVGSSGDFSTINDALAYLSRFYPLYVSDVSGGITANIRLLSGFVMAEQVLVSGLDLGWVTITGEDSFTSITRSALVAIMESYYPAFGVTQSGVLPVVGQLFAMDTTGDGSNRIGIYVYSNSSVTVLPGCGVQNAERGIFVRLGSRANIHSAIFTGAATYGIVSGSGSTVNAEAADASSAGTYGIVVLRGSLINAYDAVGTLNISKNTLHYNGIIWQS